MYMHPFSKEALTLHLARSEGHERYLGCNLMHRRVLVSSHQHLMAEAPFFRQCRLGRVLAQDGVNNKIRVLQRRAYGYRDEEYLELKIVAAFLPPLPRNAVFNPHESA